MAYSVALVVNGYVAPSVYATLPVGVVAHPRNAWPERMKVLTRRALAFLRLRTAIAPSPPLLLKMTDWFVTEVADPPPSMPRMIDGPASAEPPQPARSINVQATTAPAAFALVEPVLKVPTRRVLIVDVPHRD
jgi:hypothetical protein